MAKVRVPGVKVYTSKGILYAYDRASGIRLTPPHVYGSPEWWTALQAIRDKAKPGAKEKAGTWGGLVKAYRETEHFKTDLAPRTRQDYLGVIDWLSTWHDVEVSKWGRGFVAGLRDRAHKERNRRFANYVLSVISVVFAHAVEKQLADANPVRDVKKLRRPKSQQRANRPWTEEEWDAVLTAASPELRAAILLGGILGYRQGEALSVRRDSWNSRTGTLSRISAKSGKPVKVPAPAEVDAALRALPKHDAVTLLVNSLGRPWQQDGFRGSFFRLIRTLEAEGKVADGLTFHGLRHTAATRMRRLGFDTRTIADMLGQETEGMAAHYSREADLEPKLKGVVRRLDRENRKRTKAV
ncbi:tyrosine-type recombinase/integrase [Methylobacterium organophilum]|uniref:Tyrosine recombinase XerC n=1 Tax=Methylobacterium organophilum TaxID=410 RepID=A0ABQ4T5S1_METOR|nr:tyrosine-type recombinase/integrase [Methylobacterium organophilum]GJE26270.1 Tyrosine recombinase XerC [Methylobacterium organophilum]